MSMFSGINNLSAAMRAFQNGLEVTGHNISNINTAGFTRRRIDFGTNPADIKFGMFGGFEVGTGVSVNGVYRIRDQFLDAQMYDARSEMGRYQTLAQGLAGIEAVFPEPDGPGIADAMQKFFDGWSQLASNPNDPGARLQVQMAGATLAQRVKTAHGSLNAQVQSLESEMQDGFSRVDELTTQISNLNREIVARTAAGSEPSDLMDQRDLALAELSGLVKVSVTPQKDGSVNVSAGELLLVQGIDSVPIPRQYDVDKGTLSDGTRTYQIGSGQLMGYLQRTKEAKGVMNQLDNLANEMRESMNALHQTGRNSAGVTNIDFFQGTGASDFALSDEVAGSLDNVMSGTSGAAGDGGLALSLSKMRDQKLLGLGDRTFNQFFSDTLGGVGRSKVAYQNALDTQTAINAQISSQQQAVSGVNLDEEMTNLMRFQRSYQAAAQALTVINQTTDDLIGMLR